MARFAFSSFQELRCGRVRYGVTAVLLVSLCSCAGAPPYLDTGFRPAPEAVVIRVDTSEAFHLPDSITNAPSAAKLAMRDALHGQGYFSGFGCHGEVCGLVVLAELVIRASIATIGTIQGIQEAQAQAAHVRAQTDLAEAFRLAVTSLDVAGTLARHTGDDLRRARPDVLAQPVGGTVSGNVHTLTIRLSQFTFLEYRPWHSKDPTRYALALTVSGALDGPERPTQPHRDFFSYRSEYRPFADWAKQDAALFRAELEQAYRQLAADIVDEVFRIYRDDQTPGLPRTAFARGYFIRPLYPEPVRLTLFAERARMSEGFGSLITSEADSLRPEIRWEAVPERRPSGELPAAKLPAEPWSLRYDLRLYDAAGNELARFDKLSGPQHQVTESLKPCSLYRWTVRAGFHLRGRDRVTDWSGGYNGFEPWNVNYPLPQLFGDRANLKLMPDRKLFYYRFRTPDRYGSRCP